MCIWDVPECGRKCNYCTYRLGCEKFPVSGRLGIDEDGRRMVDAMKQVVGERLLSRSRLTPYVWGRYIVSHELLKMGYSYPQVARVFGLTHPSVIHGIKMMEQMLKNPSFYENEVKIYDEFQKIKNSQYEKDV